MTLGDLGQARILICDGPILLGWIGVLRPSALRRPSEGSVLRHLASAVRGYLRLAVGIPRGFQNASFEASLDAYPGEAFLVRAHDGRVELANATAAARLRTTAGLASRLVVRLNGRAQAAPGYELHPVRATGAPGYFLVTRASHVSPDLDGRLEDARRRWALTDRKVDVLRRLALGDANKEIASRLGISVRTVEEHLASLMALARVDSRLRLAVRLWGA